MEKNEVINLLYIEDDEEIVNIIKEYLTRSKHTRFNIISKTSLNEGLDYLRKKCGSQNECSLDVILLDLILPNSKGVETFSKVKKACSFIPIVIISGYPDIACDCVKNGAQDFLIKSELTFDSLIRSLKYSIERVKIESKLRESEKKYKELVEVTKAAIYEIDFINNKYVYVNDVMCKETGYTKEELLSMSPKELLTKESFKHLQERIKALNRGEYISDVFEYEIYKKDGSRAWAIITAKFISDKDGKIIGAKVVAIDITEKKIMEKKLRKKEEDIYHELDQRISNWKKEISQKNKRKFEQIKVLQRTMLTMTNEAF